MTDGTGAVVRDASYRPFGEGDPPAEPRDAAGRGFKTRALTPVAIPLAG